MGTELVAGIKVIHVVGVVFALIVAGVLKKLFAGEKAPDEHQLRKRCAACGWSGTVSKFKPVCPSCAKPLG